MSSMAINVSDVSDGEIVDEDFEEISSEEEDYFEKVEKRVQKQLSEVNKRKLELELQNTLAYGFGKENYHSKTNRKRPSEKKKKRKLSNKISSGSRYESTRELARNRSYRASSVFSNYSIPKRKKREKARSSRKYPEGKQIKYDHSDESESDKLDEESEDDEELLDLRLQALKSKQEVKELIDGENQSSPVIAEPTEEENLRILALKSAVLKKKEFFKERKKQKMLENERPYSPSDVLPELEMDMSLSPLGSPFNEIENQEVDMEISNDEKESSDMDLAPSPQQVEQMEDEDEVALREQLLSQIDVCKKKDEKTKTTEGKSPEDSSGNEQVMLAQSLKIVVQRLKQKKAAPIAVPAKSGTKTIAMILAEQKGKKKRPGKDAKVVKEKRAKLVEENVPVDLHPESFLIRTIVNDFVPPQEVPPIVNFVHPDPLPAIENLPKLPPPAISDVQPPSPQDSSFSTITDTKNIPLINNSLTDEAKKSRLVTSLEHVIKPVPRLIIPVRSDDTDTEDEKRSPTKKTPRRIVRAPTKSKPTGQPEFEKNLENFLKNIRKEQEKKNETEVAKPELSSVKHLPKSQQVEYQQLVQKLKVLEEAKEKALKARQLKRTKSNSEQVKAPAAPVKVPSPKKLVPVVIPPKKDKIAESLGKIPQLDKAAQLRFIDKTENNFKNHSDKLLAASEQNLKLLDSNEEDLKKQEILAAQIIELEKRLKRSKANLGIVNQRVKSNLHKIVQSSREMIKIRMYQKSFGKHICLPAGTIIKGEDYSLPEHHTKKFDENFTTIADKTEGIIKKFNEANEKQTIKSIADKVRSFVATESVAGDIAIAKDEVSGSVQESSTDKVQDKSDVNDEEESEVMKMIKEDSENPAKEIEVPENIEFPDIQKRLKGILDGGGEASGDQKVEKKLKYESPLDFLRVPKNKYE